MAIATKGSHVARAVEFFKRNDKFFAIGKTSPWENETSPPSPSTDTYDVEDLVGMKKVDSCYLVVPDTAGSIEYRGSNWRIVPETLTAQIAVQVDAGSYSLTLVDLLGITVGSKVRVNKAYEGVVESVDEVGKVIVLDSPAPSLIPSGSLVQGGALVEGARWCYVDTYLRYEQFPLVTYRQIGVYTYTQPSASPTLLSSTYATGGVDEFTDKGILEVMDNRKPTPRDTDQKELLALIIEF